MPDQNQSLTLEQLEVSAAPTVRALRLVEAPGGPQLVTGVLSATAGVSSHATTLSAFRLPAPAAVPGAVLFTVPQLLPAPPAWDVSCSPRDGQFHAVFEQAGGALNALILRDQRQKREVLSKESPFESFSLPRFVRRLPAGAPPAVSAIIDDKSLAVFFPTAAGAYGRPVRIGNASDGLLIATAKGYLAFTKRIVGGIPRAGISPGILECVRLDSGFHPVEQPFQPLGADVLIYEFDADLLTGADSAERFALLATTPERPVLAVGPAAKEVFSVTALVGKFVSAHISRPALVGTGQGATFAFLESALAPGARVWTGTLPTRP